MKGERGGSGRFPHCPGQAKLCDRADLSLHFFLFLLLVISLRFLRSFTLKTKYKDIYRPSTGAVMLLAALHTCDKVDKPLPEPWEGFILTLCVCVRVCVLLMKVSVYGFMTPDYKKYSDHYYDRNYHPVVFYVNHDFQMEMALWQRLHQAGLIRLYTRQ